MLMKHCVFLPIPIITLLLKIIYFHVNECAHTLVVLWFVLVRTEDFYGGESLDTILSSQLLMSIRVNCSNFHYTLNNTRVMLGWCSIFFFFPRKLCSSHKERSPPLIKWHQTSKFLSLLNDLIGFFTRSTVGSNSCHLVTTIKINVISIAMTAHFLSNHVMVTRPPKFI